MLLNFLKKLEPVKKFNSKKAEIGIKEFSVTRRKAIKIKILKDKETNQLTNAIKHYAAQPVTE